LYQEGFLLLDEFSDSDSDASDFDSDLEDLDTGEIDEELEELKSEDDINRFNAILSEAQKLAATAEKIAAEEKPKWQKHYTRNSKHTLRRHALKRRKLVESGQKFICSFFIQKKTDSDSDVSNNSEPSESESEEDNEGSHNVTKDVAVIMDRLYPQETVVSSLIWSSWPRTYSFCHLSRMRTILPHCQQNNKWKSYSDNSGTVNGQPIIVQRM